MGIIKAFKGKLTSDDNALNQDTIHLSGGEIHEGYRVVKLELISVSESADISPIVKLYTTKQSSVNQTIDFTESGLIGAAIYRQDSGNNYPVPYTVIFDKEVFNQDIYITYKDNETSGASVNYYLELEQITMTRGEEAVVNFKAALLHGE
jgi:hypothetical protein